MQNNKCYITTVRTPSSPTREDRGAVTAVLWMMLSLSILAGTVKGIDPDIEKALRAAPAPGDYENAVPTSLSIFFVPSLTFERPEDLDAAAKTEKFQLLEKLVHLRIPQLVFKEVAARDAFQWIAEQSVVLDPRHQGIVIAYDPDLQAESHGQIGRAHV